MTAEESRIKKAIDHVWQIMEVDQANPSPLHGYLTVSDAVQISLILKLDSIEDNVLEE